MRASLPCLAALALSACAHPLVEPAGPPAPPPPSSASLAAPAAAPADPLDALDGDEGMWTFDAFPSARVEKLHGFAPSAAWLEHVRLSSVRVGGASGSLVSARGLVMTNHHVAHRCVEQLSSKGHDLVADGFLAGRDADERRCPDLEVLELLEIRDVTERVTGATRGKDDASFHAAQKAELAAIEKECAGDAADTRCDAISLWHGGRFHLYRYKRWQDVRLVFAPEFGAAFFGGDPDNFSFPRFDLDVAFVRVYEAGAPAATPHHLAWSREGAKAGDLSFVSGHPGATSRGLSVAELAWQRDVALPARIARLHEMHGMLAQFQQRGPEARRTAEGTLFGLENGLKALEGRLLALRDPKLMATQQAAEAKLRARVAADPALAATAASWGDVDRALERLRLVRPRYDYLERGAGLWSTLFGHARTLVRAADELPKPNRERLRELGDAALPAVRQTLASPAPIASELEIEQLTLSLTLLRQELGADDEAVRRVLGPASPREVATRAVRGTKLASPKVRAALLAGGKAAVAASSDPMIALAQSVDEAARAARRRFEQEVEGPLDRASEAIARARFALDGASGYPDATHTLRLAFGTVAGWTEGERAIAPFTTFGGAFERHTGRAPFALPPRWLAARGKLDLSTPFDLVTTHDIIGGNSGSPLIDRDARVVGLVFDGNLPGLGGDYRYDGRRDRAVAVDVRALRHALERVYGATRVLAEIDAKGE